MRFLLAVLFTLAFLRPALADDCKIVWWDIFLPQSEAEFEKTSETSALLTLKHTSQLEPISFQLALTNLTRDDGTGIDLLLGNQMLVSGRRSNEVTLTVQPNATSWLFAVQSISTFRNPDGRSFVGTVNLGGYLICGQLKPWF